MTADISRIERILKTMLGEDITLSNPKSRIEELLYGLAAIIAEIEARQNLTYKGRVDDYSLLPTEGNNIGDFYFVGSSLASNLDEYAWNGNNWDRIGDSGIDFTDYVKKTDYANILAEYGIDSKNFIPNLTSSPHGRHVSKMPKIDINGEIREMTLEEIEQYTKDTTEETSEAN